MTQFNDDAMIIYNSSIIKDEFIIYKVMHPTNILEVLFIGCCPALQFMTLPDLRQNRLFQPDTDYFIKPVSVHRGKEDAIRERSRLIGAEKMPLYNKMGYFLKRGVIICDQTDETFNTVREVASAHFCSASNLTNHLNNKPGFNSVKGKTYRYKNSH